MSLPERKRILATYSTVIDSGASKKSKLLPEDKENAPLLLPLHSLGAIPATAIHESPFSRFVIKKEPAQPAVATDYVEDSFAFMLRAQERFQPNPNYLEEVQVGMTAQMRVVLLDWLFEVVREYRKEFATYFLAISLIDRFLSKQQFAVKHLQLLGTSCLLLASKIEDIKPLGLKELVLATDRSCSEKQILAMELFVLRILNFELNAPTHYEFISYLFRDENGSPKSSRDVVVLIAHCLMYDAALWLSKLPHDIVVHLRKHSLSPEPVGLSGAADPVIASLRGVLRNSAALAGLSGHIEKVVESHELFFL